MALRFTRSPFSRRKPVSIGCWITRRTSTVSPRLAFSGSRMRAMATLAAVGAGGFPHLDLHGVGPERAVGKFGHRDHALRAVEADSRADLGPRGIWSEIKNPPFAHRILLGGHVSRPHGPPPAHWC